MVFPIKCLKTTSKNHGRGYHGKEGMVIPMKCVKNDSNDFISNIKESVDVTLATDDNKEVIAHIKSFTNQ